MKETIKNKLTSFREKLLPIYDKYLLYVIIGFAFLTMLTYVFKPLSAMDWPGVIYRAILIGIAAIIFLIGTFIYKEKFNSHIIFALALYLVGGLLSVFISPYIKDIDVSSIRRLLAVGLVLANIMSVISFLFLFKCYNPTKKSIDIICLIMIGFGCFLALFSYIAQGKEIINTFTKEDGWNYDVTSIFYTKTMYGFMLLVCSIYAIIYALNSKKYWVYAFPGFFLINMLISRSKTSLLCLVIILIGVLIYHIIKDYKKYKKIWNIVFISTGSVILLLCLFIFIPPLRVGPFESLYNFISRTIFNDASVVLKDRFYAWGEIFKRLDNPFLVIFGGGEKLANSICIEGNRVFIGDNVYIDCYAYGGIIKMSLYIILVVLVTIYTYKRLDNKWNKYFSLLIMCTILFAGLLEEDSLIGISMTSLFLCPIFYLNDKIILPIEN